MLSYPQLVVSALLLPLESLRQARDTPIVGVGSGATSTNKPEDYVDIRTGTDTRDGGSNSNGNVLPQLTRPHGFNNWVPQTSEQGGAWFFHRTDTTFQGMRCTHQPSPWIGDYGHFVVLPHVERAGEHLTYSPDDAHFSPYYFAAKLEGVSPIQMEFAVTSHAAMARVDFEDADQGYVTLKLGGFDVEFKDGQIQGNAKAISHDAPAGWQGLFVVAKPLAPELLIEGSAGQGSGTFKFSASNGPVVLAIGTSFISMDEASKNLADELGSKSFDDIVEESRMEWNAKLLRVEAQAQTEDQLRIFYTNLWRSMLFPRYLNEKDAQGADVHFSPYTGMVTKGGMVADSGFWDSYRSVYTLQSIIAPDDLGKLVQGWVQAYDEAGWLPQWASPDQQNSMVGTMGDTVLADAIAKSEWGFLQGVNVTEAYAAIRKDATSPPQARYGRQGIDQYINNGFVSNSGDDESVTRTQGYWIADAAIARAADILGKAEDATLFRERSSRYSTLFNNESMFFQPKTASGDFAPYFDPIAWRNGFTEGCAWQYRFDVAFDIEGLKQLYKGELCQKVEEMVTFRGQTYHVGGYGQVIHEMSEADAIKDDVGLLAHSNQPSHHVLWIAKRAGCHEVADKYLRVVMQKLYTLQGWAGDEDNGEMASWYVLSALGIFQIEGAKDEVVLGSPALVEATVHLQGGKTLSVKTTNQSENNVYVQKVTWAPDGGAASEVVGSVMKYTDLMNGGELMFFMGDVPVHESASLTHMRR